MKKTYIFILILFGLYSLESLTAYGNDFAEEFNRRQEAQRIREEEEKNLKNKELLISILRSGIDGSQKFSLTSEIAPYAKILLVKADIPNNIGDQLDRSFSSFRYDICFDDAKNKYVYSRRIIADLEKLYTESPEQFARASVFSNTFIKPAEVSDIVMQASLSREQKDTFLRVVHALAEGTIESTDAGLQIHIREE